MGREYEFIHATTVKLAADVEPEGLKECRFISHDGHYATSAGGLLDSLEVSAEDSYQGAIPVITSYTGLVELGGTVQAGDFLKPADDGSGRAVAGTADEHCAIVRSPTEGGTEGNIIQVIIVPHRHETP